MAYRAVRNTMDNGESADWIDVLAEMEKGVNTDVIREFIKLTSNAEGGSRSDIIKRISQAFGLNNTVARDIYDNRDKILSEDELKKRIGEQPGLPKASNPEQENAKTIEQIRNIYTRIGQIKFEDYHAKHLQELEKAKNELINAIRGNKPYQPTDTSNMNPYEAVTAAQSDYTKALENGTDQEFENAARKMAMAQALAASEFMNPSLGKTPTDETWRIGEISNMLMKTGMPWDKGKAAFFTGDANPFTKNDDEKAYDRLMDYEQTGPDAFKRVIGIMETFTEEQRRKINESDKINSILAMPDVMTNKTGERLIEEIIKLRDMTITVEGN